MRVGEEIKRLVDVGRALAEQRRQDACERRSRDELLALQRRRVGELVAFATRHSPFYRERFGGELDASEVELTKLPPLDKETMMGAFDRVVTDPRVRLERVEADLGALEGDDLHQGEFRLMASGGSSGQRGVYVYDRTAWSIALAGVLRWSRMLGIEPRVPRRRGAAIGAPDGKHMTLRLAKTIDVGLHAMVRLPATAPIDRVAAALDAHRPDFMSAYPSVAAMLAHEQLAGRLHIQPRVVSTSSEVRTPEMTDAIRRAWNVEPFDCLGTTETGIVAVDCSEHRGMHVFEDLCVYEVVDEAGRPVPRNVPGARVLVTNLFNRTQPLIRFEVTDLVTVDDAPCPCGRPTMRITAIEGRSDDVLDFGGVKVHPIHLRGPMARQEAVAQYQIVHDVDRLEIALTLRPGASAEDVVAAVRHGLSANLAKIGAACPALDVRVVERLEREGGAAKLKLVKRAPPRAS